MFILYFVLIATTFLLKSFTYIPTHINEFSFPAPMLYILAFIGIFGCCFLMMIVCTTIITDNKVKGEKIILPPLVISIATMASLLF